MADCPLRPRSVGLLWGTDQRASWVAVASFRGELQLFWSTFVQQRYGAFTPGIFLEDPTSQQVVHQAPELLLVSSGHKGPLSSGVLPDKLSSFLSAQVAFGCTRILYRVCQQKSSKDHV